MKHPSVKALHLVLESIGLQYFRTPVLLPDYKRKSSRVHAIGEYFFLESQSLRFVLQEAAERSFSDRLLVKRSDKFMSNIMIEKVLKFHFRVSMKRISVVAESDIPLTFFRK